jgi:hypothetical protein
MTRSSKLQCSKQKCALIFPLVFYACKHYRLYCAARAKRSRHRHKAAVAAAYQTAADARAAFDDGRTQMMMWLHAVTEIMQQRLKQQEEHTEGMFQAAAFSIATSTRAG